MKVAQAFIAVAAAAALAGCDRAERKAAEDPAAAVAKQKDQALVRVIHALPQAPSADVYAGSQKAFSAVEFGTATSYKPVAEEQFTLALKPAGQADGPSMLEAKEGVDPGRRYTVLAMTARDGAGKLDVVTDEVEAPSAGKAMVRIIHAAPEAGAADVFATGKTDDPAIDNVDYGSAASYHEVDPANLNVSVEAKPSGPVSTKKRVPMLVEKATFEAGKAYTVVIAPGDSTDKPVRLIQVEDATKGGTARAADTGDVSFGKEKAMKREDESPSIVPDVDPLKDGQPVHPPQKK